MSHPVVHLVGFYLRSRVVRSIVVMCFIVSFAVVAAFQTAAALRLDGPQQAAQYLGDAQYAAEVPTPSGGIQALHDEDDRLRAAVTGAGGTVTSMGQVVSFLDLDKSSEQVTLWEGEWSKHPYPERFSLSEGRWPDSDRDVVVQDTLATSYPVGAQVSLFSGGVKFTVVGIVHDDLQRNGSLVLAAPGGWDRVVQYTSAGSARYDVDEARTMVRWNSGNATAAQSAISAGHGGGDAASEELMSSSSYSREDFLAAPAPGLATVPALIGVVPLTMVPVTVGGLAALLLTRLIRRSRLSMWRIGVDARTSAVAGWLAVLLAVGGAGLAGGLLGAGAAWALRPAVDRLSDHALSPFADPAPAVLLVVVSAAAGATGALLVGGLGRRPAGTARQGNPADGQSSRKTMVDAVLVVGIALVSAGLAWGAWTAATQGLASTAAATRTTVVLCIALALAVGLLVRAVVMLPTGGPVSTLALRRLRGTATTTMVIAATLALVVAVPLALATTTATEAQVMNSTVVSAVPADQVDLGYSTASGRGLSATVRHQFEQHTGLTDPVELRTVLASGDSGDGTEPVISGLPTAVATPAALERILERPLTTAERQGFETGKVLTTKPVAADQVELSTTGGTSASFEVLPLTQVPPEYRESTAGFIVSNAVKKLPMEATYYVYTGLTPQQIERSRAAPLELGFDPSWVRTQEPPVMFETPPAWIITSWVMVVLVVLIAVLLARAQARALQPYLGSLYAVGVGPSMLRRVVLTQMVMLLGLPIVGGILVGILAAAAVWALFPQPAAVTVPWMVVGVASAGCLIALVIGTVTGTVRLNARGRFTG